MVEFTLIYHILIHMNSLQMWNRADPLSTVFNSILTWKSLWIKTSDKKYMQMWAIHKKSDLVLFEQNH